MSDRSIVHADFVIERTFPAAPAKVFAAWADPKIKARWFGDPGSPSAVFDFSVGGREYSAGRGPDGSEYTFDLRYLNIVPHNRIVYAYDMTIRGKPISASLAAIELIPSGTGTRMIVTEHGAYFDGLDNVGQREAGTIHLIGALEQELARQAGN
jgi:uncharacterized protein YndB with AHSA1/START domain